MIVKKPIKRRVILIFCVAVGVLVAAENAILYFFILGEFSNTEKEDVARNLQRLTSLIGERSAKLVSTAHDWSYWDDTYKFVTVGDPDYIANNIFDSTFINLHINSILIFDAKDSLRYGGAFDLDRGKTDPVPVDVGKIFGPQCPLFRHYGQTREIGGMLLIDKYPCIFAASPIVPSVGKETPAGTMVFLSYITDSAIAQLSRTMQATVCIHRLDQPFAGHAGVHQPLGPSDTLRFSYDGLDTIRTERAMSDFYGKKILLASISQPRVIFRQGLRMFATINVLVVAATLLLVILIFLLLQAVIVKRISRLSAEVTALGKNGMDAVSISGADEISALGDVINRQYSDLRRTIAALNVSEDTLRSTNEKLSGALEEINEDLLLAKIVQKSLMPRDLSGMPGLAVAAYYQPSAGISGDLYDVAVIDPTRTALLVADVCGHGAAAALYGVKAMAEFSHYLKTGQRPRDIFSHVHADLIKIGENGRYLTAFLCIFDSSTGQLTFSRAGHPPAMLLRHETGTVEYLTGKGNYIGMVYDAGNPPRFDESDVKLDKGDRLLLYTDGIVECVDSSEKMFGKQNLEQAFIETGSLVLQASLDDILARVEKFCGSKSFADDLTLLAVEVR